MASVLMTSAAMPTKKSVGFDMPTIVVDRIGDGRQDGGLGNSENDDDDDDDDDLGSKATRKLLEKAFTYTRKSRFKSLVGDALQLTQQNRRASQDFMSDLLEKKTRRKSVMKSVLEKKKIPKLCLLIKTKNERPFLRFKRMARVVLILIQVCNVCKDIVTQGVKKEPWFALLDNLVAATSIKQKRKGPRAFVTFVPNERRELVQLTFDVSEFKRDRRSEFILTDEVRDILSILPSSRPPDQIPKVIRCMKSLFEDFNNYPLNVQKQICQKAFFDKYRYNRVIVKKGQNPDGIYFVMSGSLIEKHEAGRQPKEIQTGAIFGENDLITGATRRHTVMTRTETEILYLHRQDFRAIFNMAEDSNDPKNLEICKQHIVFQHFPMFRLETNPGTWSVLKYKYGRLIAKDSTNLDWIYVIKSGEARVFKYLEPGHIDIQARRKKIQAMINSQSSFYKKKKILNFVEERDYIQSSYSPRKYHPSASTTRSIMSAPAGQSRDPFLMTSSRRDVATCIPGRRHNRRQSSVTSSIGGHSTARSRRSHSNDKNKSTNHNHLSESRKSSSSDQDDGVKLPALVLPGNEDGDDDNRDDTEKSDDNVDGNKEGGDQSNLTVRETVHDLKSSNRDSTGDGHIKTVAQNNSSQIKSSTPNRGGRARSGSFLRTPLPNSTTTTKTSTLMSTRGQPLQGNTQAIQVGHHTLPAFVQVETLHPGQVFGLRACLDPEERGPMVSLVSGECEILQINKKFFMKHCDDAIYSLIRLKAKPWPSQEDLIDRLDVNMQWEEYKHKTMEEFLQHSKRLER